MKRSLYKNDRSGLIRSNLTCYNTSGRNMIFSSYEVYGPIGPMVAWNLHASGPNLGRKQSHLACDLSHQNESNGSIDDQFSEGSEIYELNTCSSDPPATNQNVTDQFVDLHLVQRKQVFQN